MTNEQREAIEYLKESVLIYKNTIPKISEAIETVLSMLKEKDKEIEKDRELKHRLCKEVNQMFAEVEKQDKIIDLMAEYIATLDIDEDICMNNKINSEWCNEDYTNCKECIKQYFERKCEKC